MKMRFTGVDRRRAPRRCTLNVATRAIGWAIANVRDDPQYDRPEMDAIVVDVY
jgi:hypothetical protein